MNLPELIEGQKEILTHAYSSAMAYNNLILIAGYAGFFALLNLTHELVARWAVIASAALLAISLATFVLFEVYKMRYVSRSLLLLYETVNTPDDFIALMQRHKQDQENRKLSLMRFNNYVLVVAVGSGLLAFIILLSAYVIALIN